MNAAGAECNESALKSLKYFIKINLQNILIHTNIHK